MYRDFNLLKIEGFLVHLDREIRKAIGEMVERNSEWESSTSVYASTSHSKFKTLTL